MSGPAGLLPGEEVLLVAMGVDALGAGEGDLPLAHLQLGEPSLTSELTRLGDLGVDRVVLVGLAGGHPAPGQSWLRRVAAHWWRERRGHRPEVAVATALLATGEASGAQLVAAADGARLITGDEAGLVSAAWEEVPRHRHQVLVCRGPRCTTRGAEDTARALTLALMAAELGDDDVLVTQTGCQFPCNQAPVVTVQPDDVWYGRVDPDDAAELVAEHLVAGRPLERRRLPRRRSG